MSEPISRRASSATALKTAPGRCSRAISVATRRNAAWESASRLSASRPSALATALPTSSAKSIRRGSVSPPAVLAAPARGDHPPDATVDEDRRADRRPRAEPLELRRDRDHRELVVVDAGRLHGRDERALEQAAVVGPLQAERQVVPPALHAPTTVQRRGPSSRCRWVISRPGARPARAWHRREDLARQRILCDERRQPAERTPVPRRGSRLRLLDPVASRCRFFYGAARDEGYTSPNGRLL